jgi:hypothetical protein
MSNIRDKKIYLRGALDSVQINRMRGINYLAFRCSRETQQISDYNSQLYINKFHQCTMTEISGKNI